MTEGLESAERIRERFQGYEPARDPYSLWPDIDAEELSRAFGAILDVVRSVLRDRGRVPRFDHEEAGSVAAIGVAAFISGTGPLLAWWIRHGRVRASPPVAATLDEHLRHGTERIERLHRRLSWIVGALRAEEVDPIVLKGLHTGAHYFPAPATRPAGDIDLLVEPGLRERAEGVLRRIGFVEVNPAPHGGRSEWREAAAPVEVRSLHLDHADNPWHLDLHWELSRWYLPEARFDLGAEPFAGERRTLVAGESMRTLPQPALTAFLAVHAGCDISHVRLVRLVELVLVIRRDVAEGRLRWRALSSLLDRTGASRFAYPALALAEELVPGTVDRRCLTRLGRETSEAMEQMLETLRTCDLAPLPARLRDARLALAWEPPRHGVLRRLLRRLPRRGRGAPAP